MFRMKQFSVDDSRSAMKVGTDGVMLGAWAQGGLRVLDVGTGTGVVALIMAQRYVEAQVTAIDIDEQAVIQARQNVAASPFNSRVTVLRESVQEHQGTYDAVVSNPPFFIDSMNAPDRQRNMARHTTTLTYAELMQAAWRLLTAEGELSVVVPFDYRQRMDDEATFAGFFPHKVCAVRTVEGKPARRFLLSFRKHPCERQYDVMTIGDERYKAMTTDFYL